MIPFYVKNEWAARLRALSIWGRYDDIKTAEEVEEIQKLVKFSEGMVAQQ